MSISDPDKAILKALQKDASLSSHELANRISMSQTTLWRRTSELEKSGIIKSKVALLNPNLCGFPVCAIINVNMKNHESDNRQKFESFVATTPEIMECFSVTGMHDYHLIVRIESVDRFEEFLMGRLLSHPSVSTASSQIALRQQKYTTELPL